MTGIIDELTKDN